MVFALNQKMKLVQKYSKNSNSERFCKIKRSENQRFTSQERIRRKRGKKGQQALHDFRYHCRRTAGSGYCIRSIQGIY